MSAREDIAALLFTTDNSKAVAPWSEWEHSKKEPRLTEYVYAMADAILAAGYSKPHTITTVEELDALPEGSIVRTESYSLYVKDEIRVGPTSWWVTTNEQFDFPSIDITLPATALYIPEES
ncbi:hypothetical protein [Arthrobacter sp. ES3-54]|uniref:hypothetical protein n=1 Tax=Arthrobacter sp. ES3-54 TaxID=1502991 RepID=UPI0024069B94|nr:hypothetical protein [Arthrobacter sp. ES3-54]MDF9748677.1 hypothetical protein [Arthrobacter sp. ES3-54]